MSLVTAVVRMRVMAVTVLIPLSLAATHVEAAVVNLIRVADLNTPVPGGTGNFTSFGSFAISGGNVTFLAQFPGFPNQAGGVYLFDGATLRVVADMNTPIPDGTGSFGASFSSAAISGGNVAFLAETISMVAPAGVYLFDGTTLSRAADRNSPIPDGTGNFAIFGSPVISGGTIAFTGGNIASPAGGIYMFDGVTLSPVADLNTSIPGGTGNFTSFNSPVISGGTIAFEGFGAGQTGFYLFDGKAFTRVVDLNTPVPGGTGNFTSFGSFPISGRRVAFVGQHGPGLSPWAGVYLFDGSTLSRVADMNTPVPGGTGSFGVSFGTGMTISEKSVAFTALLTSLFSTPGGLYLFDGATLRRVADLNTPVPGGTGNFTSFGRAVGISGRNIVFAGSGTGQSGIYLFDGVTLSPVVDLDTPVPGGTGNFTSFGNFAISGANIAFVSPGPTQAVGGIYLATLQPSGESIPTLNEWGMILMAMLLMGAGIWRTIHTRSGSSVALMLPRQRPACARRTLEA